MNVTGKLENKVEKTLKLKEWLIKVRRSRYIKDALKIIFSIISKLPTKKKTIVFESFLGKQYSDNPKALYLYLNEHYPEYQLYWSVDRHSVPRFEHKDLTILPRFGLKWIFIMARADYWITNSRLPEWIPKSKRTVYVQTWHGTPLKRLAADMEEVHMPGTDTEKYKCNFLKEAKKWDYLISPNRYSTNIFSRAFQFNKTVIESGYPRNDFLTRANNEEMIKKLKRKMKLPFDKKIILYAPTWRDNEYYERGKYKFELQMDLTKMQKQLSDGYFIILRLHYLIAENLDLSAYESFVSDFSNYEDIRDLYLVSDALITDYSSVFFDYANLNRTILFYVYDLDTYRDKLRGFYFDFENEAPGPLLKTTDEIIAIIKQLEANNFQPLKDLTQFYKKFCYLEDGQATKRVVETLFNENIRKVSGIS